MGLSGFPNAILGLSVFFVGDLMGKALWKLVEPAARFPSFPTLFWGLSVFFVGDLMGKALWKLVEPAARFPSFPTLFWGLSVFFVGDLMGKALWKLVEPAARFPSFPTLFWGLSVFFVGDLMGKALWKLVEPAARFPMRGGRVLCVPRRRQLPQGPSVWAKMAPREGGHASCRAGPPRPLTAVDRCITHVHVKTADLYRPNARLIPERQ